MRSLDMSSCRIRRLSHQHSAGANGFNTVQILTRVNKPDSLTKRTF